MNSATPIELLRQSLPDLEASDEPGRLRAYGRDWTRFHAPAPAAVVFPRSTEQVVAVVRLAREHRLALVPSGGRTGLSAGAVAASGEVVVSMDRMRRVLDFDPAGRLLTVEAGVPTAVVQARAEAEGLYYPVSFASEGSAQIGGNIATNAGGIRVLRHGLTRDRVAGLTVVDGRGRVLELNRGLVKNASGYDLRHLMVGSEGTLGIIVQATLALIDPPPPSRVLLLGAATMDGVLESMRSLRAALPLSACEFFSASAMDLVCQSRGVEPPLAQPADFYLLVEFDAPEENAVAAEDAALAVFQALLERGCVDDGVLSQSDTQAQALWLYREAISEAAAPWRPYKNDLSVRVADLPSYLAALQQEVDAAFPDARVLWYGHVGDGNLHLNVLKPEGEPAERFLARCSAASGAMCELTESFGGSVSAEHGIGLLKRALLHYARSEAEIELMRGIKQVFDPDRVLNPGKLI